MIKFIYGMGFVGTTYFMEVDGIIFSWNEFSFEDAKDKVIEKLKELNLEIPDNIYFEWDGTM